MPLRLPLTAWTGILHSQQSKTKLIIYNVRLPNHEANGWTSQIGEETISRLYGLLRLIVITSVSAQSKTMTRCPTVSKRLHIHAYSVLFLCLSHFLSPSPVFSLFLHHAVGACGHSVGDSAVSSPLLSLISFPTAWIKQMSVITAHWWREGGFRVHRSGREKREGGSDRTAERERDREMENKKSKSRY